MVDPGAGDTRELGGEGMALGVEDEVAYRDYALTVGLRMLTLRHLVLEEQGLFRVNVAEMTVVAYYANSIVHLTSQTTN